MMSRGALCLLTLCISCFYACGDSIGNNLPSIKWIEGESVDGESVHTVMITNASALEEDWIIYCAQFPVGVRTLDGSDAVMEQFNASMHTITPVEGSGGKDTLFVHYASSRLHRRSWAPEGFVLKKGENTWKLPAEYEFLPLVADGDRWFSYNQAHAVPSDISRTAIVPTPKNRVCTDRPNGWYRLIIADDGEELIESQDEDGAFYAKTTLDILRGRFYPDRIPAMTIEDWPDFQYRGYMLDLSRNFTTKENLFHLIDILARYKVNYLHLHLADDEGWRLEVDDIPELTRVGAFHSLDVESHLQPSYDGCIDPSSPALSNGYYTTEDFKRILQYAWERRIRVIPEFDTPGHSRAAIYSMKAYERRTGDSSMRLQDPLDDSKYYTAQGYTDNVMNVEMESVYTFVGKIFDHIISVYADAGVPLPAIHIGGDEVPQGAWHGENLHRRYLGRVARIAADKGVKIAGWQEVAMPEDEMTAKDLKAVMFMNNTWITIGDRENLPFQLASQGYPTVMSNVQYTYADQAYSDHMEEPAHDWAGYIDCFKSFELPTSVQDNILGVQAQLWTETIRSFDDVCYDSFPKILGVFERGWNSVPAQSPDEFFGVIVAGEMPYWEEKGIAYHIPQPGLKIVDGEAVTNTLVPGATVEVSKVGDHFEAVAKYGSRISVTTIAKE